MAHYINILKVANRPRLNVLITTPKDNYVMQWKCSLMLCGVGNGSQLQYSCWKILWIEEPGRLQSVGSQSVGHDWAHTHTVIVIHVYQINIWYTLNFSNGSCQLYLKKKEKRKGTWQPSYEDQTKLEMAVRLLHLNGHFSALRFIDLSVAFD